MTHEAEGMNDEMKVPTLADIASVTFPDVMQFLDEKVKNSSCPVCNEKDWSIIHSTEQLLSFTGVPSDGSYTAPPQSIPIIAAVCVHCGYARPHVLGVILQWKRVRDELYWKRMRDEANNAKQ